MCNDRQWPLRLPDLVIGSSCEDVIAASGSPEQQLSRSSCRAGHARHATAARASTVDSSAAIESPRRSQLRRIQSRAREAARGAESVLVGRISRTAVGTKNVNVIIRSASVNADAWSHQEVRPAAAKPHAGFRLTG